MTRSLRIYAQPKGFGSIDALYQLGCGRAGVQSEYNCRIFSADHTLHILRADIYVGIMFGMLMRPLGSPPFPLFRPPLPSPILFRSIFRYTSKYTGRRLTTRFHVRNRFFSTFLESSFLVRPTSRSPK